VSARDVILVTGAAGFIGSHFARLAHEEGSRVIGLDAAPVWAALPVGIQRVCGDFADVRLLVDLYTKYPITAVVHFAGRICVGESVTDPALYYDNNLGKSLVFLDAIKDFGTRTFVFSSSAAVYGAPGAFLISESAVPVPLNPYGATKHAFEQALSAFGTAYGLRWCALRYFNAAGAHPDGTMAEAHRPETHLIPLALDAALGRGPELTVFGTNYPTPDGSCCRDYVHVQDLAWAHLHALDALDRGAALGAVNLGSGQGYSTLEVIEACRRATGRSVPYTCGARRVGDPHTLVADTVLAQRVLGWKPVRSALETIVEDALRSRQGP
jgi:UDP-glucose-4-epimerase GalE